VATQAAAAKLKKTRLLLENNKGIFEADGVRLLFPGFLKITGAEVEDQVLPNLEEGSEIASKKMMFWNKIQIHRQDTQMRRWFRLWKSRV
jgi:DNA topoisomerase IA